MTTPDELLPPTAPTGAGMNTAESVELADNATPWLNRGTDVTSRRVYALLFNGLTQGLADASLFVTLASRSTITGRIYDVLREGGVEIRLEDGLAKLRRVAEGLEHP